MIFGKFWRAIAAMQYEYDKAVDDMKGGREGLEQYRGLVERVTRQVEGEKKHLAQLQAKVKAYLASGDRETAGKFAVEMNKAKQALTENEASKPLPKTKHNWRCTKKLTTIMCVKLKTRWAN